MTPNNSGIVVVVLGSNNFRVVLIGLRFGNILFTFSKHVSINILFDKRMTT